VDLRLYLDDNATSRLLRHLLADAGYEFTIPSDVGLDRADDARHASYAIEHGHVLVTKNPGHFQRIYEATESHPGLLLIYRDNDATRDMTDADIVQAIRNLIGSGVPLHNQVHVLNHWRY
jgi:predicted nuclease of predicted toxin-antitoxin system